MKYSEMTPEAAEKLRAYQRAYAAANKDKARARKIAFQAKRWAEAPEEMAAIGKAYRDANPDKVRAWSLRQYGITPAQFDAIYDAQDGKCAVCRDGIPRIGKGRHLDHCHATNRIRGILCLGCNHGLGNFRDRPDALVAAASYLQTSDTGLVLSDARAKRANRPKHKRVVAA
jgi:hypothetical protein